MQPNKKQKVEEIIIKCKRLKNANTSNTFNITAILKNTRISDNSDTDDDNERPSFSGVNKNYQNPRLKNNYWNALNIKQSIKDDDDAYKFFHISEISDYNEQSKTDIFLFSSLKYQNFILMITGDRNSIHTSATKCGCRYEEKERVNENGEKICEITLNGKPVSEGKGPSGKIARKLAFDEAMKVLQKECYSIKVKPNPEKINISRTNETITAKVEITSEFSKLDSNNIGYKMMQKLGWTGGALGVRTKGREEPIDCLTIKNNRKGLGNETDEINANYFRKLLKSYTASDDIRELHFDSCFTKEDRAKLHQIATSKNLKSTSYGKGIERYLVVSKRTISPENIIKEVLINKNPMYINKYEVKVPVRKRKHFPDHVFENDLLNDDN
ncbi:NF-kappa-B-repressing factor isoform X2 [Condylostylus longicornis]|uniref:NF-kappa-B-repressing factor isoform X2 n=1 Tax=Condylostylus longicornis TaxID=2530218 RepID=UPI00244E2867|nr:NF-kappa-B-repressing factor isoform X2 [Condylostylus longicornis]